MIIGWAENWLSFKSSGNATATVVVFHHQSSRLAIYPHLTAPKMRDVGRPRCLSLGHDISEDGIGFLQALKEAPCRLTDLLRRLFNYIAYKGYFSDAMPCSSGLRRIHLGSRHDFVMLRGPFWDHPFSYGSWMMLDFDMFISRWTAQLSTDATFLPGTCSGQHEAWHPEPGSLGGWWREAWAYYLIPNQCYTAIISCTQQTWFLNQPSWPLDMRLSPS